MRKEIILVLLDKKNKIVYFVRRAVKKPLEVDNWRVGRNSAGDHHLVSLTHCHQPNICSSTNWSV